MNRFLLLLATSLCLAAAPAGAVEVTPDDSLDAYAISGAVILDASAADGFDAISCSDCQWRIIPICKEGVLDERRACTALPITCPVGSGYAEVWRADAPTMPPIGDPAWNYRGVMCLLEPPAAVREVSAAVRDLALRSLPALRPAAQPASTTLTSLPTLFRTGQPSPFLALPAQVAGTTVTLRADPVWTWDFGHGLPLTTSDPGASWPHGRVRHTYPRRGLYRVRVTATWRAEYSAHGISGIPVDGPITQSAWIDLRVREARGFLTSPKTGA